MANIEPDTKAFADALLTIGYGDLPDSTVTKTKQLIKDFVGVAMAGHRSPECDNVVAVAEAMAGEGDASVLGRPDRIAPAGAALANGTIGHGWDFDDNYDRTPIHVSSPVIPATLALGQTMGASGADLIRATALGGEAQCRLAVAAEKGIWETGWHRTATTGTFGAAIGGAALLDLDLEQSVDAIAIAHSQAAGNFQSAHDAATTKRFQPGHAAMGGVLAALLAREGVSGPADPLTGPFGFFEVYEHDAYDPDRLTGGIGRTFRLEELSLKPYPCCRAMQSAIDAARRIHESEDLAIEDVETVRVETSEFAHTIVCEPQEQVYDPDTIVDLQFSLPYGVVVALDKGEPFIDDFTEAALNRDHYTDALSRVNVEVSEELTDEFGREVPPGRVTVETTDGRTESATVPKARGHPENEMSEAVLNEKFRRCLSFGPNEFTDREVTDLLDRIDSLEKLERIEDILAPLEPN